MPDFAYIARDQKGQKVTGTLTANTEREVIGLLSGRDLFPIEVKSGKAAAAPGSSLRVKGQVMATMYSQLAALLRSGVPLLRSISVLRDQTSNPNLKEILDELYRKVEDGTPMGDVMARFPRAFSDMAINMVRAGSEGGFLEDALERVASFTETQEELKGRTISAVAYPLILASVGTTVVTVLIVFFVPKFATMFERLKANNQLPMLTDWLLKLSDTLRNYGLVIVAVLAAIGVWLYMKLQTEEGRRLADLVKIRIPMAGSIFLAFAVARFCRVLGTLLHNGVPILKALEISREAAGNRILSKAIADASENISAGQSLAAPLASSGHFPKMVVEMISVAEESNTLDRVLVELADSLERRTARQLDLLVRLLEPVMLLILAFIILIVVIALLVPVITMSSSL
ncbi:type II secretion system protein [Pirellula staleyi DSM 6068]|uniref:Type II secretion system protein n=1 Tax=Pirellula staleyi (strain ATCC 27377 / DSM 6068 / ICPB 4128) TaxID=530564 RepID=D2QZD8_PIRSD|nr:type II secretion system F family protein [Pirellula staleyi]ADB18330.1 type II secretion system protein [Pirellula staleyi DSM 6068]